MKLKNFIVTNNNMTASFNKLKSHPDNMDVSSLYTIVKIARELADASQTINETRDAIINASLPKGKDKIEPKDDGYDVVVSKINDLMNEESEFSFGKKPKISIFSFKGESSFLTFDDLMNLEEILDIKVINKPAHKKKKDDK